MASATTLQANDNLRRETYLKDPSFIASTPAPVNQGAFPFAGDVVSVIKTSAAAATRPGSIASASKCSASKELTYEVSPTDQQALRRDTYLASTTTTVSKTFVEEKVCAITCHVDASFHNL
jgi:hypothetical protein